MHQTTPESVTIGKQVWMTRNLNVTTFRNGDPIFQAKNDIEWLEASKAEKPACCFQDFHPANEARYGRLYKWYAVGDPRGISPEGFHVPSDREWLELVDFCGEQGAGRKLKSTQGWQNRNNGTNESGFTGLPGGGCTYGGGFIFQHQYGFWWGSTVDRRGSASTFVLFDMSPSVGRYNYDKSLGQSVRCLRD
ncbi:fibrobacter succinogenes major paralogous domain-containing protein [Mucilaginibacter sp.]